MSSFSFRAVGFIATSTLFATAMTGCSVDLQQVFASSDGQNAAGGQGGQGAAGGGGSGQGGETTTTTADGGSTTGTTSSTSTSTSTSSTSTTTSTTTTSTTTTSTTTTTVDPGGGPIGCDNRSCESSSEICCWDKWGIGTGNDNSGDCQTAPVDSMDCDTEVEQGGVQSVISCQTSEQCAGDGICCGDVVSFNTGGGQQLSYYPEVACRETCQWPSRTMCKGPNDQSCPTGTNQNGQTVQLVCKPSTLLPEGYFVCGVPN